MNVPTTADRVKLVETAKKLAQADFEANGVYANAPYTVWQHNIRYVARIRTMDTIYFDQGRETKGKEYYVCVEQPVTHIGETDLQRIPDTYD